MRLRITSRPHGESTVLQIDGQLVEQGLGELERARAPIRGGLYLDLTDLRTLDEAGANAIRRLLADGAEIVGVSRYVSMLLGRREGRRACFRVGERPASSRHSEIESENQHETRTQHE